MSSRRRSNPRSLSVANPPARPSAPRRRLLALAFILCLALTAWWWLWMRPGPAHERRGEVALAAGRPNEAEQEWRKGIQADPQALGCYEQLGDLYLTQKRFPEAAAMYTTAARLAPTDGTLFLRLTRAAEAEGDLKAAEAAAKRAADLRPDDPDASGLYGLFEVRQKKEDLALAPLRRAHQLRPEDRDYLLALVQIEIENVAFAQAEQDLKPFLSSHPDDGWATHLMAVIYELKSQKTEDWKTALAYEQKAQTLLPNDPRIYLTLGDLYFDLERPADALKAFQTGRKLLPNSEAMLHGLVKAYNRTHNVPAAAASAAALAVLAARHQRIPYLQEQLRLNPSDTASGVELARLQEVEGDPSLAQRILISLLKQVPQDVRAHRALSDFYARHHRPVLAQQALRLDYRP